MLIFLASISVKMTMYSQGTIGLGSASGIVYTNGSSISEGTGPMVGPSASYYFEVLDMTSGDWTSLSGAQQSEAADLLDNPSAVSLWTDSAVGAINSSLHAGGINGVISTTAANWSAPSGSTSYGPDYDYYVVVGWSSNEGTSWSTVSGELGGSWADDGWFGETAVAYNYAGGGLLPAVSVWATSATTGLDGSGFPGTSDELTLVPVSPSELLLIPEPSTWALAGIGCLSMLFLRRRKA